MTAKVDLAPAPSLPDGCCLVLHGAIREIDAGEWDACAGPGNPFLSHAFLSALEDSGAAQARTGWQPQHLALTDAAGRLLGCVPMYLKGNSYGEYVFDHGWAAAYERAGGRYYPKLQVAVPFTPVPGPRLLVRDGVPAAAAGRQLLAGCLEVAGQRQVSSLHITFCSEQEWREGGALGLLQRTGEQFHWENRGYETFEDFLNDLASRKRKAVRKERREALAGGITVEVRTGAELAREHWDAMFRFYMDTGNRKWGSPYLNRDSFRRIADGLAGQSVLMLARRAGRIVAGALNFQGSDTLYGRYWGCNEEHPFLHFELCYYQAIDYAIRHRLQRVEAGAQGPHKLARGYLPKTTYSLHWIADSGFRRAVARYLEQERAQVAAEIQYLDLHSPFRHEPD